MSFDTEFDFSRASTQLTGRISTINANIASVDSEITQITNLPATYDSEKTTRIAEANLRRNILVTNRDSLQSLIDAISALTGLSAGDKQTLYNFWNISPKNKASYMQRMLYNHSSGLVTDAAAALADSDLDTDAKRVLVCDMICGKYPLNINTFALLKYVK